MQPVHIINPFHSSVGGSEQHALSLFDILAEHTDVHLWTEYKPDSSLIGAYPIHGIEPHLGRFPKKGNFVFIGAYFGIGPWLRMASPSRVIVFFNTPDYHRLESVVEGIRSAGVAQVDVSYQAKEFQSRFPQYPGPVHPSPINLEVFRPQPQEDEGFVVGRYSRDAPEKHHANDPDLYRRLADAGCKIRIMGGVSQKDLIADDRVELLPAGAISAPAFLAGLDCFIYRTRADLFEAFGRVVAESMACGVPVVAENRGGFTHLIQDGENGFLFEDNEAALEMVLRIKDDASLRAGMGHKARESMVRYYSPESQSEMIDFYVR